VALAPSAVSADREAVRRGGFPAFTELALRQKLGSGYKPGRHITIASESFERLHAGEAEVLSANLPPGHTKSQIFSVCGPAWIWTVDPKYVFMCASYDADLARFLAGEHRDLCESSWYRDRWGDILITGSAVSELWTTSDGFRLSTSVKGGRGIGRHCHMYIVDDPFPGDNSQGLTPAILAYTQAWFRTRVLTRGRPGYAQRIAVVAQRLHQEDLSGYILETYKDDPKFEHLMLPLYFEPERKCKWDWRTEARSVLWPEEGGAERRARHFAMNHGGLEGQAFRAAYQQDPHGGDDQIFKSDTFKGFENAPAFRDTLSVISVDPTFTGGERSDLMAIEVWGFDSGHCYCYHSEAVKRGFTDAYEAIKRIRTMWPATHIIIEASANGHALQETLDKVLPGVMKEPASKSKENRARAASHYFTAGRVHFDKKATWYEDKARDLIRFPGGVHDDRVDTTSQAVLWLFREYGGSEAYEDAMRLLAAEQDALAKASDSERFQELYGLPPGSEFLDNSLGIPQFQALGAKLFRA
jgi:predicted phage terminase large subunit-like protein